MRRRWFGRVHFLPTPRSDDSINKPPPAILPPDAPIDPPPRHRFPWPRIMRFAQFYHPLLTAAVSGGGATPTPPFAPSDNFNRAGPSLGANWADYAAGIIIFSNVAGTSTASRSSYWVTAPPSADYWVQALFPTGDASWSTPAVALRMTDASNFYFVEVNPANGSTRLRKRVTGTNTTIQTYGNQTQPVTIRLQATGTTLLVTINAVPELEETDTDLTAAGNAGIAIIGGDVTAGEIDDWSAGTT